MSWNKNTLRFSQLDTVKQCLDNLNIPYKIDILGHVKGMGLNDAGDIVLRKLTYKNSIILEYVERTADCDDDDYVMSEEFSINNVPEHWELELWEN